MEEKTTDLGDIILGVIRHVEINIANKRNIAENVNVFGIGTEQE